MPSFISKGGIWTAANERAVDINTGVLYEGPDREAKKIIKAETGSEDGTLGIDAREDSENIMRARQMGMSIDEYLKLNAPLTPSQKKVEEEKKTAVVTHASPKRKPGVKTGSGKFGELPV